MSIRVPAEQEVVDAIKASTNAPRLSVIDRHMAARQIVHAYERWEWDLQRADAAEQKLRAMGSEILSNPHMTAVARVARAAQEYAEALASSYGIEPFGDSEAESGTR